MYSQHTHAKQEADVFWLRLRLKQNASKKHVIAHHGPSMIDYHTVRTHVLIIIWGPQNDCKEV